MTKPFQYQRQDSELTLKEGLAEYYEGHPGLFRPSQLPKDSARLCRHKWTQEIPGQLLQVEKRL